MKYSVIDIGSNSVRHLKADVSNGNITGTKSLIVTRLGEGVDATKKLTNRAIKDTVEAIRIFKKDAEAYGVQEIFLMATSAVRDASNKSLLIDEVKSLTGLTIDVLSGESEAIIGCIGVQKGLDKEEAILIIDIGGGSTEFIVFDGEIRHASSADVGAVRMTGKHVFTDPITRNEKENVIKDIRTIISPHIKAVKEIKFEEIIGIGGTATTFGAIDLEMETYDRDVIHNHMISTVRIAEINKRFQQCTFKERVTISGLEPKRADIITAGGLILQEIMSGLEMSAMKVSDFDNLEGYLAYKLDI